MAQPKTNNCYISTSEKGITKEIYISVPWGIIAAKVLGRPFNSPVLCLHGWLDNCNTFDNLIPLLPLDKYYVFIDFPGHGKSSAIPLGFYNSLLNAISVIERVVSYFQWKTFSFLSHSMGAHYSGIYAAVFPEKVDKLVLLDSIGCYLARKNETETMRASIESYMKLEKKFLEPKSSFSHNTARSRLLEANRALNNLVVDIILERGTNKLENGKFEFARDIRHIPKEPSSVSSTIAVKFFEKVQAETLHTISSAFFQFHMHPENRSFARHALKHSFISAEYHEVVDVGGNHFIHLCEPEKVIPHIKRILNRPPRPGLLKSNSKL